MTSSKKPSLKELFLPQSMQIAVCIGSFDFITIHQGKFCFGRIPWMQFLSLVPLFGVQANPFNVMFRLHRGAVQNPQSQ